MELVDGQAACPDSQDACLRQYVASSAPEHATSDSVPDGGNCATLQFAALGEATLSR